MCWGLGGGWVPIKYASRVFFFLVRGENREDLYLDTKRRRRKKETHRYWCSVVVLGWVVGYSWYCG